MGNVTKVWRQDMNRNSFPLYWMYAPIAIQKQSSPVMHVELQ